jgi:methionyl-tRNA formyltransferase
LKLVFMGTPDFAVPALQKLIESEFELACVVTRPDKPSGRGRRMTAPPVKGLAESVGIPVLQPDSLKEEAFLDRLRQYEADLFVVVAFVILPPKVLEIPGLGSVNLHPSLLPKYRGAAPINWAIIRGEAETGITVFRLTGRVDAGDMLYQERISIGPDETAGELYERMKDIGAEAILNTVRDLAAGPVHPRSQGEEGVSRAPKLTKQDGCIDWTGSAKEIRNLIRGTNPFPGAFTGWKGKDLKVHRADVVQEAGNPGEILVADGKSGMVVAAGEDALRLIEVQPPGKARMSGTDLVRGYQIKAGEILG